MAIKKILQYPNPALKKITLPSKGVGVEERLVAKDLVETMYASPGVGLAAPQINELLRIMAVDVTPKNPGSGLIVLINPEITTHSGERIFREGCLSIPEYTADIRRFEKITVSGLTPNGERVTINSDGFEAIALQHEIDHLDGILFIDRIESIRSLFKRKIKDKKKKK
ncbi:MAG: peptide deformylase [Deltaproteobacteria bacterium]|nr:peptide deformylase [Deltaproteobacteria bacterium]